jgi:hypothetical protein
MVRDDGGGCISAASPTGQAEVGLDFGSAGSVELISETSGSSSLQLAWVASPASLTAARGLEIPAGPAYLNVSAAGTIAVLTFSAASERLCGVAMPGPAGAAP